MTDSIVIYSGGLDSTCLLYYVKNLKERSPEAIIFDYGQKHRREIEIAIKNCNILGVPYNLIDYTGVSKHFDSSSALTNTSIKVPDVKDIAGDAQPPTYVPYRNMMFATITAAVAESKNITEMYYGAAEVDTHSGHWDCSLDFLYKMGDIFRLNRKNKIEILAPFITKSKADIIKIGVDAGVNFNLTHTCYNGEEIACGKCTACSSRIAGFIDAGFKDSIEYNIEIPWKKLLKLQ